MQRRRSSARDSDCTSPAPPPKRTCHRSAAGDAPSAQPLRMIGLHEFLDVCFWPPYRPPLIRAHCEMGGALGRAGRNRGQRGFARGRTVDRQLTDWCDRLNRRKPFLNAKTGKPPRYHKYTNKLIAYFNAHGMVPSQTQVPVAHRQWNVCTRADLVMWDTRRREWVLVEVKTGSTGIFTAANGQFFNAPLEHVHSTPLHHAMAQLTLTALLFGIDERHRRAFHQMQVVVVNDTGVAAFELANWCSAFCDVATSVLAARARAATGARPRL